MSQLNQALIRLSDGEWTDREATRQRAHRRQRVARTQRARLNRTRNAPDNLLDQAQIGLSI
jgi:hypothetical protein